MTDLLRAIISQGHTSIEARQKILEMSDEMQNGADPEILLEERGLEADFLFDLLEYSQ